MKGRGGGGGGSDSIQPGSMGGSRGGPRDRQTHAGECKLVWGIRKCVKCVWSTPHLIIGSAPVYDCISVPALAKSTIVKEESLGKISKTSATDTLACVSSSMSLAWYMMHW